MESIRTDLPFKLEDHRIIVVKDVPVEQCIFCGEYELTDTVMEQLEILFDSMDESSELEVRRFAA
jgi:YgiT-type zinc finger domain-containing protein